MYTYVSSASHTCSYLCAFQYSLRRLKAHACRACLRVPWRPRQSIRRPLRFSNVYNPFPIRLPSVCRPFFTVFSVFRKPPGMLGATGNHSDVTRRSRLHLFTSSHLHLLMPHSPLRTPHSAPPDSAFCPLLSAFGLRPPAIIRANPSSPRSFLAIGRSAVSFHGSAR